MNVIAKEVGRAVEKAPEGARLGLWFGLLRGCDRAMADAPSLGKDPKVSEKLDCMRAKPAASVV